MEGRVPSVLKKRIEYETALYESFLDGLVKKIGEVPKNIQKTITSNVDILKFIYNVIADKTGENLKKGIATITNNIKRMMDKITEIIATLPEKVQEFATKILEWLRTKMGNFLSVKSDVDNTDNIKGDASNWKKFISLLLGGCLVVALYKLKDIVADFGKDKAADGLQSLFGPTLDALKKTFAEPDVALQAVGGASVASLILPIFTAYKGAKILQTINDELLNNNTWLKKS